MLPPAVVELCSRQRGLVATRQLLALGISSNTIGTWQRRNLLLSEHRTVFRVAGSERTPLQAVLAATMRAGEYACASGWTACSLYGLEGFSVWLQPWIMVPPTQQVRGTNFIIQRAAIDTCHRINVAGIPAVTVDRALIDAAIRVGGKRLRIAIDDARRRRLTSLEELLTTATSLPLHPGAARIRKMFIDGGLDQDGEIERRLAIGLAKYGVYPLWGAEVLPDIFPDAAMPEASLIIECDGRAHHTIEADVASDLSRESPLRRAGWGILRFTGRQIWRKLDTTIANILDVRSERMAAGLAMPANWQPLSPARRLRPG